MISDESEITETVICNQRTYIVPKDVADKINSLVTQLHDERTGHYETGQVLFEKIGELEEAKKNVVYGFYLEEIPSFRQATSPPHELEQIITAGICTDMVNRIKELTDENRKLKG